MDVEDHLGKPVNKKDSQDRSGKTPIEGRSLKSNAFQLLLCELLIILIVNAESRLREEIGCLIEK